MSTIQILYIGNNSVLDLANLRNEVSGQYLDAVDVSVTLYDQDAAEVGGSDWPLPLDLVAGAHGLYRVTLPYTLALNEGARYTARVVADAGLGLRAQWDVACVARLRL